MEKVTLASNHLSLSDKNYRDTWGTMVKIALMQPFYLQDIDDVFTQWKYSLKPQCFGKNDIMIHLYGSELLPNVIIRMMN